MKKKTVIIISLIICLIVGILATISIEMDEASRRVETTETVKIVNGIATPSKKVLDFEIKESGSYEFYLDWMIEKEGFISGINIVNEAGESVSCCTGDWAQIEMFPKRYEAGKYQIEIHYLSSLEAFEQFVEQHGSEVGEDAKEYPYADNAEIEVEYSFSWKEEGAKGREYKYGFVIGIVVAVLLMGVLIAVLRKGVCGNNQYDERQELIRGRAFKYGFFTMMFSNVIFLFLKMLEIKLFQNGEVLLVLSILLGVMIFASYCIWNDAYFALNDNRKSLMIMLALIGIFNTILGVQNVIEGNLIEGGSLAWRGSNLYCGLMLIEIFVVMFLKHLKDKKEEQA